VRVLVPAVKKPDRFEPAWIGGVEDGDAVAEHVAHVEVAAVEHHLHAVGPAALIAVDRWRMPRPMPAAGTASSPARAPAIATPEPAHDAVRASKPFSASRREAAMPAVLCAKCRCERR
jgi:hypothetical protein